MVEEMREAIAGCSEPILMLSSTDGRAFCAGGDLSLAPEDLRAVSVCLYSLYPTMLRLPSVIVTCAQGSAIGAGAQLLLASDLRVGTTRTSISFAGAATGLALGTWGLPGLVGTGRAMELSLSGRTVGGEEALAIGLLNTLADDPEAEALRICGDLAASPPSIVQGVKHLVRMPTRNLEDRLRAEADLNVGEVHVAAGSRSTRR